MERMIVKITIPASLDEAIKSLTGIDGLLTAKEWERSAIVYAFTVDGRTVAGSNRNDQKWSIAEFAAKGVVGLSSRDTVRRYRQAWQAAIDAKLAEAAVPGARVALPTVAHGEFYVSEREQSGRAQTVELPTTKDHTKLVEHFERHPDTASAVIEAAAEAALADSQVAGKTRAAIARVTRDYDERTRIRAENSQPGERERREQDATRYEVQNVLQRSAEFRLAVAALADKLGLVTEDEKAMLTEDWLRTSLVGDTMTSRLAGNAVADDADEYLRSQS